MESHRAVTDIADIVNGYVRSDFIGDEGQDDFLRILSAGTELHQRPDGIRQPSESTWITNVEGRYVVG